MGAAAQLQGFVSRRRALFRQELAEWVRIPSIAGDPERVEAVHRSAAYLAGRCRDAGFPRVEVWSQGDSAAVFAEWMARPGAPTVLVYSHHDVRAIRPELWTVTAPFEPLERDGLLFGRGASDAKGQVLAHLLGLQAHVAVEGAPAVNVRLLVDGEEELGSPHLATVMETHAADMHADLVLFSDTLLLDADRPAVCTSVRGMIGATLTVHGPEVDVHSGTVSGTSPNPVHDLARVIAALHDDQGRLAVPGLEAPGTPDDRQRAQYAALGISPAEWVRVAEISRDVGDPHWTIPERLWARPEIEVISVQAGDTEGVPRAVIPATARAELSIRLAGDQDPQQVAGHVERWVRDQLRGIRHDLEFDHLTAEAPYRTPDHPAVEALAAAMAVGFETDRVGRMGNGGGGPADLLARRTGAPVLFFGTGLPSDRWHAPDEHVRFDVLERAAVTLAEWWRRLPASFR